MPWHWMPVVYAVTGTILLLLGEGVEGVLWLILAQLVVIGNMMRGRR